MHIHTYVRKIDIDKQSFEVVAIDYRHRNLNNLKQVVENYINGVDKIIVSSYVGIVGPLKYIVGCDLINKHTFDKKKRRLIKKSLVKRLKGIELVLLMTP